MTTLDDLLNEIFDGKKPSLYREFEGWVKESRRFKAFAASYRVKIRAKLRNVRDQRGMSDLRAELETAALLLHEERFTLEYEKYAASKQRGPDFTVTYKTHTPFNIEVRCIHSIEWDDDTNALINKLMAVLSDKVRQMPPGIVNLLWLNAERAVAEADLTHAVVKMRQLAEQKAEDFFTRRGFENATGFLNQFRKLSGIVLRQSGGDVLWLNSLARHAVPPEIVNVLKRLGSI